MDNTLLMKEEAFVYVRRVSSERASRQEKEKKLLVRRKAMKERG
jgi:hypothetical protein